MRSRSRVRPDWGASTNRLRSKPKASGHPPIGARCSFGIEECLRDHEPRVQQVRKDPEIEKSGVSSGIVGTSDHENRPREIQGNDHENIGVQTVIRRRWMLPTNKWKTRRIESPQKSGRIHNTNDSTRR